MTRLLPIVICCAALLNHGAFADDNLSGSVSGEIRAFNQSPAHPGQRKGTGLSIAAEPEYTHLLESGDVVRVTPFARLDSVDAERTHADIRELYWQRVNEQYEVLAGVSRVFWGVAESRHLVNIVNQVDAVEDLEEEAFLGQPMINFSWLGGAMGTLRTYILPGFRERTLPSQRGRLRPAVPFDTESTSYESDANSAHVDFAARYSITYGDFDIGISGFHGTGREPRLIPAISNGALVLTPHYDIITQGGVDVQGVHGNWLFKYEAITREGQGDTFYAHVGGVEYTFYNARESGADIGLLVEHLFDGRDWRAPPVPVDNGIFLGTRLSFNDTSDTSLLFGAITDISDGSSMFKLEASRRLNDNWKMELDGWLFLNTGPYNVLDALRRDDHAVFRLIRHF